MVVLQPKRKRRIGRAGVAGEDAGAHERMPSSATDDERMRTTRQEASMAFGGIRSGESPAGEHPRRARRPGLPRGVGNVALASHRSSGALCATLPGLLVPLGIGG